jgi:hypothetical protein
VEEKHPWWETFSMTRIYVMVEGQTEETFVREVLYPHFLRVNKFVDPILVSTSPTHKGGVTNYDKVKPQLIQQCREKHTAYVTTMFDLYALPNNFPGKEDPTYQTLRIGHQKASYLEQALAADIGERNFIPNLMVHEFEAILFSDVAHFSFWTDESTVNRLKSIADDYPTPEDINDSPQTAPSKRILQLMPEYDKVVQGTVIAGDIGLDQIRAKCSHFGGWVQKLEQLVS